MSNKPSNSGNSRERLPASSDHPEAEVFVVSAPSGTGKTTLNRRLIAKYPQVEISVSYTTRSMRQGEIDGVHYHFVTEQRFHQLIDQGQMLEHAHVFGTLYGTSRAEIDRLAAAGKIALLEIDVQGWRQAHQALPQAKSVFILPPSAAELWQRLEQRGTEALAVRWRRFMTAKSEIASGDLYDYFIVNHNLDDAFHELEGLIIKGQTPKLSRQDGVRLCQQLLAEFATAPWIQKLAQQIAQELGQGSK